MLHSNKFTALLDACVLYPAPVRDLLLSLAQANLYIPKWSDRIQNEWVSNLISQRPELKQERLQRTVNLMNDAFEDSRVDNFDELIPCLRLPDINDNHVLAAAIKSKADVIVTYNLNDFPPEYVSMYDIEVQHPDQFVVNSIELDNRIAMEALVALSTRLRNPKQSISEILDTLERSRLNKAVNLFRSLI